TARARVNLARGRRRHRARPEHGPAHCSQPLRVRREPPGALHMCTGFVQPIQCAIGSAPIRHEKIRKPYRRLQGRVVDYHVVVPLERLLPHAQDLQSVLCTWLANEHLLEATLERRVSPNPPVELSSCSGTYHAKIAA